MPRQATPSGDNNVQSSYQVHVTKDYLVFCAAHFITYEGDACERLHGHNYRTSVTVEGPLDENHYVIDFIALKDMMRSITDELDHRVLLPTRSQRIQVDEVGGEVEARYEDRRWIFPREDCMLLPIENTTAELLARWIVHRLREALVQKYGNAPPVIRVEVEESFGQSATCEIRGQGSGKV